jgi:hypothetical protein
MDMILYYFKRAFPPKTVYVSDLNRNRLHGIRISSKRMRLLNRLKKITNLTRKTQDYINRYHVIYKIVINEAKRGKMIGMF